MLGPEGEILYGEKCPGKEKHGCNEEKYRQVELFDPWNNAGKEHADGAKGNPTDEGQRNDEETMGITDKTE